MKRDLQDPSHWVFNRLADAYHARPQYPSNLIDRLCALFSGDTVADLGAGTGHLSFPLAARGFAVYAVEPAAAMREQLTRASAGTHPANKITSIAGTAEETTLPAQSVDNIVAGEAAQWFQLEKVVVECRRILRPKGVIAAIEWAPSTAKHHAQFLALLARYNPKTRGRTNQPALRWIEQTCRKTARRESFVAKIEWSITGFIQATRSYSYVGPALGAERLVLFETELREMLIELYQQEIFTEERSVELYWESI